MRALVRSRCYALLTIARRTSLFLLCLLIFLANIGVGFAKTVTPTLAITPNPGIPGSLIRFSGQVNDTSQFYNVEVSVWSGSNSCGVGSPIMILPATTDPAGMYSVSRIMLVGSYSARSAVIHSTRRVFGGSSSCVDFTVGSTTSTSVNCASSTLAIGASTTCTATVTDATGSISGEAINWLLFAGSGSITFSTLSCMISGTSCSVTVTGAAAGSVTVQASYSGDSSNLASSGTFTMNGAPIPEYPSGLLILAVFMMIAYGIVKSLGSKRKRSVHEGISSSLQIEEFVKFNDGLTTFTAEFTS